MKLCRFCSRLNPLAAQRLDVAAEAKNCYVCKGTSERLSVLAEDAIKKLKSREYNSFFLSTTIPKDMMAREEDIWDFGLGRSVKDGFNKELIRLITRTTGLNYNISKADVKLMFDIGTDEVHIENSIIFIYGKYKKFRNDLAQSEWTCKKCNGKGCDECNFEGMKYDSVEVVIGKFAKELYAAKDTAFHASGREDIDALNLAGRPFVLELKKPQKSKVELALLEKMVNESGEGVEISDLKYVSSSEVALVADSHFDKWYEAEMEIEGGLSAEDEEKIVALKGVVLNQRTPHRVKHRRSDLVRKRKILDLRIEKNAVVKLYVRAEAGTYIKEFISGDEGRTQPSISEVIGKKAKCIKLSVVEIEDEFLDDIIGGL